jgi:transcriptional regulator with XRE-family HTH domain
VQARPDFRSKLAAHAKTLADLRRARQMTQHQLARLMQVSQAQVSRVENQADLYLSTLRSYIEAMGGELQIRVAFPGADWAEVTIGDVTKGEDGTREGDASIRNVGVSFIDFYLLPQISEDIGLPSGFMALCINAGSNVASITATGTVPTSGANVLFPYAGGTVSAAAYRGWLPRRPDALASNYAYGRIHTWVQNERTDLMPEFCWQTADSPRVPSDADEFVSSANIREK